MRRDQERVSSLKISFVVLDVQCGQEFVQKWIREPENQVHSILKTILLRVLDLNVLAVSLDPLCLVRLLCVEFPQRLRNPLVLLLLLLALFALRLVLLLEQHLLASSHFSSLGLLGGSVDLLNESSSLPALTDDLHVSLVFVQLPIKLEPVHLCVRVRPFAHELLEESYEWESKQIAHCGFHQFLEFCFRDALLVGEAIVAVVFVVVNRSVVVAEAIGHCVFFESRLVLKHVPFDDGPHQSSECAVLFVLNKLVHILQEGCKTFRVEAVDGRRTEVFLVEQLDEQLPESLIKDLAFEVVQNLRRRIQRHLL